MAQEQTQALNPLKAMEQQIATAKNVKDLLKIDIVSNRYIANYEAGTGRKDGRERFEREAFAFMEMANSKPDIMECDPISIFAGFIKAGVTGLSFSSNKLSVYPRGVKQKDGSYKKHLVVEPDAHGKKEMLERMPEISKVDEGVVVFKGDEFEYSPVIKQVTKHIQKWPVPKASEDSVVAAYVSIHFTDNHREDIVLSIEEIKIARSKSRMEGGGELWKTHFGEACKKTAYNRAYKVLYKFPDTAVIFKQFEPTEETIEAPHQVVEQQAEEVVTEEAEEKPKKRTKTPKIEVTDDDFT